MATNKSYIKPQITVISVNNEILCSSQYSMEYICSEACKLWHICQDRKKWKRCLDKKYS